MGKARRAITPNFGPSDAHRDGRLRRVGVSCRSEIDIHLRVTEPGAISFLHPPGELNDHKKCEATKGFSTFVISIMSHFP